MFLISTGYLFLIHILIKEGLGAAAIKEPIDTNDIITKENLNRDMQNTIQHHQNQQIPSGNSNIPQQIPMQQRNMMMQQQIQAQQNANMQQIQAQQNANMQQIQAQQNANMQQNQYKQNPISLTRPLQLPIQNSLQQLTIPSVQIRPLPPVTPKIVELLIKKEDTEQEKTDKANEMFEKLMQFMTIMGQVDTYLSEKAQTAIKTIAHIADESTSDTSGNKHDFS